MRNQRVVVKGGGCCGFIAFLFTFAVVLGFTAIVWHFLFQGVGLYVLTAVAFLAGSWFLIKAARIARCARKAGRKADDLTAAIESEIQS